MPFLCKIGFVGLNSAPMIGAKDIKLVTKSYKAALDALFLTEFRWRNLVVMGANHLNLRVLQA